MTKKTFSRLRVNVNPIHYKVSMKIDIEKREFNGSVEADITVRYSVIFYYWIASNYRRSYNNIQFISTQNVNLCIAHSNICTSVIIDGKS